LLNLQDSNFFCGKKDFPHTGAAASPAPHSSGDTRQRPVPPPATSKSVFLRSAGAAACFPPPEKDRLVPPALSIGALGGCRQPTGACVPGWNKSAGVALGSVLERKLPGAGGPRYQWSRRVEGKTITVALSQEQFAWASGAIPYAAFEEHLAMHSA